MRRSRQSGGPDVDLERLIRADLAFLFRDYAATIVSNNYYPRPFGNSIIVLLAANVRLRVVIDRRDGDFPHIDIAPVHIPDEWESVDLALSTITGRASNEFSYVTLAEAAQFLERNFAALNDAFSPARYPDVQAAYKEIHPDPWLTSYKLRPGRSYPVLAAPKSWGRAGRVMNGIIGLVVAFVGYIWTMAYAMPAFDDYQHSQRRDDMIAVVLTSLLAIAAFYMSFRYLRRAIRPMRNRQSNRP